jgi:L-alanine-DL-glutamate epimerase-like enolase superfamily enzyme
MEDNVAVNRRGFIQGLAAGSCMLSPTFYSLAETMRKKVKITDVKCMIVRGTWDWNLIKIETDAGVSGIGEAYWGPGVKDIVLQQMKALVVGEDPMNVDKLYTKMLLRSGGYGAIGGVTITAASGIEIALWDLAGRLLGTPVCNLLGGRFRDRVRFYRTLQAPPKATELSSWRDQAAEVQANNKYGFTAWKFQGDSIPLALDPTYSEPGHDFFAYRLTNRDITQIVTKMDAVRSELGPDKDFAIECHWKYQTQDAIELLNALEHVKPMWLEDPVPPENTDSMTRVSRATRTPICTGENLYGLHGFRTLIESQACAGVHIDIPKSGGLMESKRISDFASLYNIWTAAHNPASPIGTIASAHAASAMRNFRIHELAKWVDWWPDLVLHEGPFWTNGFFVIEDKPGLGIEINPDVAKAHLAPGEVWWG